MHIFEKPDNLVELIENSVEKYPDNKMFGTKNKEGEYEWITYREIGKRIDNLRGGLSQAGIEKGDIRPDINIDDAAFVVVSQVQYSIIAYEKLPGFDWETPWDRGHFHPDNSKTPVCRWWRLPPRHHRRRPRCAHPAS